MSWRWFLLAVVCIMSVAFARESFATEEIRLSQIEMALYEAGYYVPSKDCLLYIQKSEQEKQMEFTADEIIVAAQEYLYRHGNSLVRRRHCFTCSMRVLTPQGYRPIGSLTVGDAIYSWDELSKQLILNQVRMVHIKSGQAYGVLPYTPTGVRLEVTPFQEFLLPLRERYEEIGRMRSSEILRGIVLADDSRCEDRLIPNVGYTPAVGRAYVYTVSLLRAPANFIVEGLVVKNKPDYILKLIVQAFGGKCIA